ncbi:ABC transporter ATP-binding protein [Sphaerimonospora sp. CA-214678]|uniref:ABC transporter ATP-binding protein n=1 Tax=Sphaerimonospora sp. CA-214678 TaxID=3240029 RepID=UPI003D8D23A2
MFGHYVAVADAEPDLPLPSHPLSVPPLRQGIELRDVWFRYSENHPWLLRGVNIRIPTGKALAVVGLNGVGKSTLIKLLCRFYDPEHGAILWDGVDIRDADVTELRQRIGVTFQDHMDYSMTAAENIAVGNLKVIDDEARIQDAAKLAGVHNAITRLPRGYRTLLTRIFFSESEKENQETGVVLSGGQWQRLALARALMRNDRDLMILDEPSSGLDAKAEHEIHLALKKHRTKTSILISHRLSTVREADRIVILSDGIITEEGNHDTLMSLNGEYAKLFRLQASGYQMETNDELLER